MKNSKGVNNNNHNNIVRKLGSPQKARKKKSKPGWEFRLETQIKNLRKQTKMIKQKKDAGIIRNKNEMTTRGKTCNTT